MNGRPIAIGRGRGIGRCIDRTIVSLAFLWLGEITDQLMVCSAWASVSKPSPLGDTPSTTFVATETGGGVLERLWSKHAGDSRPRWPELAYARLPPYDQMVGECYLGRTKLVVPNIW